MSRPRIKNVISGRRWETIRGQWLDHVQALPAVGDRPDPGLEHLPELLTLTLPDRKDRCVFEDIPGLRSNMLSEAVFLFHKCAHSHLAAQRLGTHGMHSWCMFNAYHAAYLGARGILALLGIGLPTLPRGGQFLIDIYPVPENRKAQRDLAAGKFTYAQFHAVQFGKGLDQVEVWEALERLLSICDVSCWTKSIHDELRKTVGDGMTKVRNAFLYKSAFWPLDDLMTDGSSADFTKLIGGPLDTAEAGFLLRLSYITYRLFEDLMVDFGAICDPVKLQLRQSRIVRDPASTDLVCYTAFLTKSGLSAAII
jgi:hypothetical protein